MILDLLAHAMSQWAVEAELTRQCIGLSATGARWGMTWMSEQAADRIGEALPNRPLVGKRAGSVLRHRIDAPLPSGFRRRPMAAQQAVLIEPMKRRVNRPLREREGAAAAALNLLDHRIAMRRPARQRGKHDHVEVPFEHFAFHAPERYP